jgi:hypothetical protein
MSALKPFPVIMILFVSMFPIFTFTTLASSGEDVAVSAINRAEEAIAMAYQGVLEAEKAGADVSGLLARLNAAGKLLAEARISYRLEDFDGAVRSANLCYEGGEEVRIDAYRLRDLALKEGGQRFRWTVIWSILGVTVIVCASFVSWRAFKRRYSRQTFENEARGV